MARSIWKGPFVDSYLIKKVENMRNLGRSDIIQTYSRRSTIIPEFIGVTFGVHNGQKNVPVSITEDMIGKKLGEFSPTRTFKGHGADKKSKR